MKRLIAPALLLLAACGTRLSYMPTNTSPKVMSVKHPSQVEVFMSSKPSREFVEVGMIEGQQESVYSQDQETEVFAKLREEAADRGCDGLIISGSNDSVVGETFGNGYKGTSFTSGYTKTLRGYRGTCIVYTMASAETPAPKAKSKSKSRAAR